MTPFQKLRNMVLISIRRKEHYSMHYKMWNFIAAHLLYASDELLNDANYIFRLKKTFLELNNCGDVYLNCFLCDLYYGTLICNDCSKCPLHKLYDKPCADNTSPFSIVISRNYKRDTRIKAAKIIRDCVLRKGGK